MFDTPFPCGTVFKASPGGGQTMLYSFTGFFGSGDGVLPRAGLYADSSGNLYGTTSGGGASGSGCGGFGCGTVFKLSPGLTETVLHSFCSLPSCSDGANPQAGLIADSNGILYGTASGGGGSGCGGKGCGVVFKLTPGGTETVLYSFAGGSDGGNPFAGLIADSSGNLYGTTNGGGASGNGVVFKLAGTGFVPPPTCGSKDAVLANIKFPTSGTVTFEISSPARTLQSITLATSSNIGSSTLPAVQSGGHSATGGVFIKANSAKPATFELLDTFVNPAFCCLIDPLTTTLKIKKGHKVVQAFQKIPDSEHFIEIGNGSPGLRWLRIEVNGKYDRTLSLNSGRKDRADLSAAMNLGQNTLTFTGEGKTGTFATIEVSDSAPSTAASPSASASRSIQETGIWGHLMFEKEVP